MTIDSDNFMATIARHTKNVIITTDRPWALNRDNVRLKTAVSIIDIIGPLIKRALEDTWNNGYQRGVDGAAEVATGAEKRASAARRRGYEEGRAAALLEAATMLKRHGHRTAVTRVQTLAETPARPQPAQSPADGPGHPTVDTATEPPEPLPGTVDTKNGPSGAQKGPVGPETATPSQPVTRTQVRDITREVLHDLRRQQARRG